MTREEQESLGFAGQPVPPAGPIPEAEPAAAPEPARPEESRQESLFRAGREHLDGGRTHEAAQCLERALQLDPQHALSARYLGLALLRLGDRQRAVELLQDYLRREPEDQEALWQCGMACLEQGRFPEAERGLRRLASLEPRASRACLGLGQLMYRRGLYTEAAAQLRKAEELEPGNPEALFLLGETCNKLNEVSQAIVCFEAVLEKQRDNSRAYYNLGILYDKKGLPAQASEMYRRAKQLSAPSAQARPAQPAGPEDTAFFSRALTLVGQPPAEAGEEEFGSRERYEQFRKRQLKRRPHKVLKNEDEIRNVPGKMDLTKASLKIHEALRVIKENKKLDK